jgi:hypothetical protein
VTSPLSISLARGMFLLQLYNETIAQIDHKKQKVKIKKALYVILPVDIVSPICISIFKDNYQSI